MIDYCQKLTDSGYHYDHVKKIVTGGLTGYERRRGLSMLDPADRKLRPLHESRKHNVKSRRIAKMMSKHTWFKRKPEDPADSPGKKRKLFQKDGNSSRRIENLPDGWKTFQMDGHDYRRGEVQAQGGEVMGEGEGGDGMDGLDGVSAPEDDQASNLVDET